MRDDNLKLDLVGKVGFTIGTGRCGTKFLSRVVELEPLVASSHERNPYNETFHRYAKWFDLPIDHEGFLVEMEKGIRKDLEDAEFSFESSAYLSLSVEELYERFSAKFVLLVRSPERVVNSFHHKGWYETPTIREDPDLAPSYQESESFHHVLARFVPSGEKFETWNSLTRVGKIAWYWNAMNARILEQFQRIPPSHWRVEKIEELDYTRYVDVAHFLGYQPAIEEPTFVELVERKPNSFSNLRTIAEWTEQEIQEFESEVAPLAEQLGYEYRIAKMAIPEPTPVPIPQNQSRSFLERIRNVIAG